MKTLSALLAICAGNSPVTGEFPTQRPVTRGSDVFFDLLLNERLSKQSWGWWFETPWRSLWRHCNAMSWWGKRSTFWHDATLPSFTGVCLCAGVCVYVFQCTQCLHYRQLYPRYIKDQRVNLSQTPTSKVSTPDNSKSAIAIMRHDY